MPIWKVLFIMLFAGICFGLVLGTLIAPLALDEDPYRWLWCACFLLGSIVMSSLFALYLRNEDRTFKLGR